MKITLLQFKELLKEQIESVVEAHDDYHDDEWFDVEGERPPMTGQTSSANVTSDEEFKAELDNLVDQIAASPENPEDIVAAFLDKHVPSSSEAEPSEEEDVQPIRLSTPTRDPMRWHDPIEKWRRHPDNPRNRRIKESELKDMIRATLEEVMAYDTPAPVSVARSHGASGRQGAADFTYDKEGMGWKTLDQMDSTDLTRAANDLYSLIYGHLEIEAVDTYDPTEPLMMLLHALLPGKIEEEKKDDDSFSDAGKEIEKKGTEGVFTKKAKKRGMTAQEFARKVLANTDEYSLKTVRQASFAKGSDTVAKKRKKK